MLVKEKMKSFDKNTIEGQTELVPYNPLIKKLDEEYDSRMTLKLAQESDAQFG